jgi:hypothetical protein
MLIEELFANGTMMMGPSPLDPGRQVGIFTPAALAGLGERRAAAIERFRWLAGRWRFENLVPATRHSPAYGDAGVQEFALSDRDTWISSVLPDGSLTRCLTFDPLSRQWIYVLARGAFGMLRSRGGWIGNRIVFEGLMTMVGLERDWRMTWTAEDADHFRFVNEERTGDTWIYVDEWRFTRVALAAAGAPSGV